MRRHAGCNRKTGAPRMQIRGWDVVYYASLAGGGAASVYYAVFWWAAGAEWWWIALMIGGMLVCGYVMGGMVHDLWFGNSAGGQMPSEPADGAASSTARASE